eukprot:scaffold8847_cov112-Isochrysis_galbana.AAC.3
MSAGTASAGRQVIRWQPGIAVLRSQLSKELSDHAQPAGARGDLLKTMDSNALGLVCHVCRHGCGWSDALHLGLVVDGRRDGCLQADQRGKRHPRLLGQGGEDRQGAQQRRPPGGCHRPAERQERLHVATSAQSHDQRAAGHRAGGGRRGRTSDGTGYVAPVAHNGLACCPSGSPTILGHAMALRGAASCRCHPLTPAGLEADIHPVDVRGASP